MGLVLAAQTERYDGQPATPNRHLDRRLGNTTRTRKLDLAATTYVTGGMALSPKLTGLSRTYDMEVLGGFDPRGRAIQANGYQAVYIKSSTGYPDGRLQLWYNGAQMGNGASAAAGKYLWVRFIGLA